QMERMEPEGSEDHRRTTCCCGRRGHSGYCAAVAPKPPTPQSCPVRRRRRNMRAVLFGIVLALPGCQGEQPGGAPAPTPSNVGSARLPADRAPSKIAATEDQKDVLIYCPVAGMKGMKDCCPDGWCGRRPTPDVTTAYKGGVVQFCCKDCLGE